MVESGEARENSKWLEKLRPNGGRDIRRVDDVASREEHSSQSGARLNPPRISRMFEKMFKGRCGSRTLIGTTEKEWLWSANAADTVGSCCWI
jgi:hypothetical protein